METTTWQHGKWFAPNPEADRHPALAQADELVVEAKIDQHPFFAHAAGSRAALRLWVAQELVVTGPFAQVLLTAAAGIPNVHIRAMVVEVAYGEHGKPGIAIAEASHPWLLDVLRASMGIDPSELRVLPETTQFLKELDEACAVSPLAALGALGIGSEKLLVPEYTAVKESFAAAWPDCAYETFLDANIDDDTWHAELMAQAAGALMTIGGDPAEFLHGARMSIDSRLDYYTSLLATCRSRDGIPG